MQIGEIARFFGVPDVMIGGGANSSNAWPASMEQQILMFLNFTIQPYLDEWESAVKDSFLRSEVDVFIDHDVSNFIKMDSNSRANFLSKLVQNGLLTRNEGRSRLNLPEVEGGDELTVQTNLSPLDQLEAAVNATQEQPNTELPAQIQQ